MPLFRQGDVLLIPTTQTGGVAAPVDPRGLVLAEGETSGHHHQVFGDGAKLFRFKDAAREERLLTVGKGGAEVRVVGGGSGGVPRHEPIQIGAGSYLVRLQRAWTAEDEQRSRQVED